ncbi:hypothetical protein [uncultured Tateyamaria sp.]|uniref:hypothetical protein n=1 Tax=uncultured Tateyamaria sp. TaxID=455651 RepID=UPI00260C479C|nr:hypothetical protein [uncultured Tateyamaria sp.]
MSPDLDKYRRIGEAEGEYGLSNQALLALWASLEDLAARPDDYPPICVSTPHAKGDSDPSPALHSNQKEASP